MTRCRNVLVIVASLSGGGAERVAVSWAGGLSALGHRVTLLTDTLLPCSYKVPPAVEVVHLDTRRCSSFLPRVVGVRLRLLACLPRLMRRLMADVVIDVGHLYATEVFFAARLVGVKALQTDHNPCTPPLSLHQCYHKFILSRFYDRVTVLSSVDHRGMVSRGVRNAVVLHNPLPFEPYSATAGPREKTLLAVGRLDAWHCKGFDLLLDAWSRLSPLFPGWRLRIIGDGSPRSLAYLRGLADATVDFVPFTENMEREYRRAAIFVLSSRREGWGLVAVEAMSQGCAVIACDCGGRQAEYITDGENGLLCPPGVSVALEHCIGRLITDEYLRHRLQQCAPATLAPYSQATVARRLHALISSL